MSRGRLLKVSFSKIKQTVTTQEESAQLQDGSSVDFEDQNFQTPLFYNLEIAEEEIDSTVEVVKKTNKKSMCVD